MDTLNIDSLKYKVYQFRGMMLQQWIKDPVFKPREECHIDPCTVKIADLASPAWAETYDGFSQDTRYIEPIVHHLGLKVRPDRWETIYRGKLDPKKPDKEEEAEKSDDSEDDELSSLSSEEVRNFMEGLDGERTNFLEGSVAPGILFVSMVKRKAGAGPEAGPWCSQICQAVYEKNFPIDSLNHIILGDVANPDTRRFIIDKIYTESNGLSWPHGERLEWKIGTPEYKAILGTRLGTMVGYIILGAFSRGTRRISRIFTWDSCQNLHIRFDIEHITPPAEKSSPATKGKEEIQNMEAKEQKNE